MDLTDRTELATLAELIGAARDAAPGVEWLLVGAMARDLLLHYGHGIRVGRATEDVDLAIAVSDWEEYERVRRQMLDSSLFTDPEQQPHRLRYRTTMRLDIVPFGGVEQADRTIAWPPNGEPRMTVIGFAEAFENAQVILLPDNIDIAVVNLPMLILLKIIAWYDRKHRRPGVDANDALFLLSQYLECGNRRRLFSDHADLLDNPCFDYEVAGAVLAGRDLKELLTNDHPALSALKEIIQPQVRTKHPGVLIREVPAHQMERFADLLGGFLQGLSE